MTRGVQRVLWAGALMLALLIGAFNLVMGDLNQDEGWYLYAARLVAGGDLPYRDFAFTQGPVMPLAYAALSPLWSPFGLAGARVLTALLGLLAALGGAVLARRLVSGKMPGAGSAAGFVAFCLIALNMYQSYFSAVVKTYSLCGLLLVAGFLFLSKVGGSRGSLWAALAAVCLALAAATRLSAFMALPVTLGCLWACRRGPSGRAWIAFMAAGLAAGALIFLPFFIANPQGLLFGLLDYHAGRSAGGAFKALVFKAGFFARVAQAYAPALVLWAGAVLAGRFFRSEPEPRDPLRLALWGSVLAMTAIHLTTAFPYDDYQVPVYPLFAASVVGLAVRGLRTGAALEWLRGLAFAAGVVFVLGSPLNQEWMVQQRDRIWWRMKDQPPLVRLQRAGREVRRLAPRGGELLTQDIYLAVEAGMTVPRGFELGQFCYFPDFTDEKAAALHVVNGRRLREILGTSQAPAAAFSGYGLAMRSPAIMELEPAEQEELWALVRSRYEPAGTIPFFGQASTTLRLFVKKDEPGR
jgi:hypothetical protein